MASDAPIVRVEHVSKVFQTGAKSVTALQDVSLELVEGEFVALLGPSGCGKSTLLNVLGGLLEPTEGLVTLRGEPITEPSRSVGMMFQTPVLFPWRTTLENILLPAEIFGLSKASLRDRAIELLGTVGLGEFTGAYPWQLSGGMGQRAALARVLLYDPTILLLDEPFGALDEFTREAMDLLLLRVWSETRQTAVFVTHNINEAIFVADRVAVMTNRPGRLVKVIDVPLPRPRERAVMQTPEFTNLAFEVRALLGVA
jgi:NitT/TauT family transport system ATP-binding protein